VGLVHKRFDSCFGPSRVSVLLGQTETCLLHIMSPINSVSSRTYVGLDALFTDCCPRRHGCFKANRSQLIRVLNGEAGPDLSKLDPEFRPGKAQAFAPKNMPARKWRVLRCESLGSSWGPAEEPKSLGVEFLRHNTYGSRDAPREDPPQPQAHFLGSKVARTTSSDPNRSPYRSP